MNIAVTPAVLVFLGGGFGALLRYVLGSYIKSQNWSAHFFWHTFLINVIGSIVLGIVAASCKDRPALQLLIGVGICGGFTTFSTFSIEVVHLLENRHWLTASAYVLGSVLAGVLGAWIGLRGLQPVDL